MIVYIPELYHLKRYFLIFLRCDTENVQVIYCNKKFLIENDVINPVRNVHSV